MLSSKITYCPTYTNKYSLLLILEMMKPQCSCLSWMVTVFTIHFWELCHLSAILHFTLTEWDWVLKISLSFPGSHGSVHSTFLLKFPCVLFDICSLKCCIIKTVEFQDLQAQKFYCSRNNAFATKIHTVVLRLLL